MAKSRRRIAEDPNRPLIDRALAMGIPMDRVARKFGYPKATIVSYRNRMEPHLKAAIIAAQLKPSEADLDQLRIDESESILGNLAHQRARLLMCQDECMETSDFINVNRIAHTIHDNIKLVGHYLGLFSQYHVSTQVNLIVSEEYLKLRSVLLTALRPYPEARAAVSAALHQVEAELAQAMTAAAAGRPAPRPTLIDVMPEPKGSA